LSKGFELKRFFAILDEIELFFSKSVQLCVKDYLDFLYIKEYAISIAFLIDIFKHIYDLNFKLLGKEKLVWHQLSEMKCFSR